MAPARTAVFTIVAPNYWHFAQTLMASVAGAQPGWDRHVLLLGDPHHAPPRGRAEFAVTGVLDLPLPRPKAFLFRYTILEASTAVKPWMFESLFARGYDRVVYLDPDIRVYGPLRRVEELLDGGALMVLTPHLTAPLDDGCHPSEVDILRAGVFNLGFLALARRPQLSLFLAWWQSRLEHQCVVDPQAGLFVDQKWMDLAPGLFDGAAVLRDPGYNVAYWNLAHRPVARDGDGYTAGGRPLAFFHFSGVDPKDPSGLSRHQDRFRLEDLGPCAELVRAYCLELLAAGGERFRALPYPFAAFSDGVPVSDFLRRAYRRSPALQAGGGEDPFGTWAWATGPAGGGDPPFSPLMEQVWLERPDVQRCYPDPQGRDRREFAGWFAAAAPAEYGMPEAFVAPVRASLAPPPPPGPPPPAPAGPLGPLRRAARRLFGGAPPPPETGP